MPMVTRSDFIRGYVHNISSDFQVDGHPPSLASGHPLSWGSERASIKAPADIGCAACSVHGSLLALACGNDILVYLIVSDSSGILQPKGGPRWTFKSPALVTSVYFHPDGNLVVSASYGTQGCDDMIRFWPLVDPSDGDTAPVDSGAMARMAIDVVGQELVNSGNWSAKEVASSGLLEAFEKSVAAVQLLHTIRHNTAIKGRTSSYTTEIFTPDGSALLYIDGRGQDVRVVVWDLESRSTRFSLDGHTDTIIWAGVSPDGKLIGSSSWDQTVRIWDLESGAPVHTLTGTTGQNWTGRFSPDSKYIVAGSGDKTVRVWRLDTGETVSVLEGFSGWTRGLNFSPDGKFLATASARGIVRIFDYLTSQCVQHWQLQSDNFHGFLEIWSIKYSADGSTLAFKTNDGRLVVWHQGRNLKWEMVQSTQGDKKPGAGDFFFSLDGGTIISCDSDQAVRFWSLGYRTELSRRGGFVLK